MSQVPGHRDGRPGTLRLLLANPLAAAGLAVLALVALVALAAPLLPLPDPAATALGQRLLPPLSPGHPLGTDALGRDLLSRLVWGTRLSLAVALAATLAAALLGSLTGLVAGFAGGAVDGGLMRFVDLLMAFPYILLALAIVAVLGPGLFHALLAIAAVNVPFFARTVRGATLGLARRDFVDAARLGGAGPLALLATEILPNVLPVIVVTASTSFGWMILETAGLSFLGLGAQPPLADLGAMLGEARKVMFIAPHVSLVPGVMVFVIVMAINLAGDGLRDALDPRLRSGVPARPAAATEVRRDPAAMSSAADPDLPLQVTGLRTEFRLGRRSLPAVAGVDLALPPGARLGLVGESGSGKSATALSLLRLVPSPPGCITAGQVRMQGRDVLAMGREELRALRGGRLAMVFQDPMSSLHPMHRIGDQVAEALRAHAPIGRREARRRAADLLARVRIPAAERRLDAWPHELSGGMRQRVAIAIALANDPAVLVADEATTALDVTVQAQVLALLHRLTEDRGTALLFISHDLALVGALCDRIAVLYAGQVVEEGPAAALLAAPAHPYTAKLLDCLPRRGGGADPIAGLPPAPDNLPPGCAFAPRCPHVQPPCSEGPVALDRLAPDRAARCLFPLAGDRR
ncbi:dipeptide/oligopeptide/nickel ABC transporter permease/ATP-binding protein [Marinibaculum pumilum]|uniref:Dipeptide/oligopeptide/nickel ABC transporter permease/ATP-binding protein n=1 Tax=Marinibaculum pumilum TaxID=1766165 RepID=A0ABV7L1C0_9PROT